MEYCNTLAIEYVPLCLGFLFIFGPEPEHQLTRPLDRGGKRLSHRWGTKVMQNPEKTHTAAMVSRHPVLVFTTKSRLRNGDKITEADTNVP